jgi:hypothetical protein
MSLTFRFPEKYEALRPQSATLKQARFHPFSLPPLPRARTAITILPIAYRQIHCRIGQFRTFVQPDWFEHLRRFLLAHERPNTRPE